MELKLIELTQKNDICKTYEIYRHCMFMPTEEKFHKKMDAFLADHAVKIFACYDQGVPVGVMVISFVEGKKIEILGIAVETSARNKGIGSYMIKQLANDSGVISVYAETDKDAVGFYRKNSFEVTEFSEIYDGEAVVRYRCTKLRTPEDWCPYGHNNRVR